MTCKALKINQPPAAGEAMTCGLEKAKAVLSVRASSGLSSSFEDNLVGISIPPDDFSEPVFSYGKSISQFARILTTFNGRDVFR